MGLFLAFALSLSLPLANSYTNPKNNSAKLVANAQTQQDNNDATLSLNENKEDEISIDAGPSRDIPINNPITFEIDLGSVSNLDPSTVQEILWDFGNGIKATGDKVKHTYSNAGRYTVTLSVTIENGKSYSDTAEVNAYNHLIFLAADNTANPEQLEFLRQQAASKSVLLLIAQAKGSGPDVLIEEELTKLLINNRSLLNEAHLIITWTSGGVGANVLTKFSQQIKQTDNNQPKQNNFSKVGVVILSQTPFAVIAPTAQSAYDQLQPDYVLLSDPQVINQLLPTTSSAEAKSAILKSSSPYRLLGAFSTRTVSDLQISNFMSFGVSYLVNRGVPVNSIILILMLPVIATIIAFARQAIGIKAFGLITPAMTTVSFLVMGLRYGLIVFTVVLLSGTVTRSVLRKLRLLYLPRMALVLTSVSFSLLLLLSLGVTGDRSSILSFSIFPALILTILAEEFIAAQFRLGLRTALTVTAWTLALATACYLLVNSEIFRALILSYPEITLLAIPLNLILGKWSGLRLSEYFRFRHLLHYDKSAH